MHIETDNIYHIFNQGNNRQRIFLCEKDYHLFLKQYKKTLQPVCDTIAWSLMPNHFHFMVSTKGKCVDKLKLGAILIDPISNGFRKLLSRYAQNFNTCNLRTGSLFRQKTQGKCLSEISLKEGNRYNSYDYIVNTFHYIHLNPLISGLVKKLEDWEFSSYRDFAGLRKTTFCNMELAKLHCGYNPATFVADSYQTAQKKMIEGLLLV